MIHLIPSPQGSFTVFGNTYTSLERLTVHSVSSPAIKIGSPFLTNPIAHTLQRYGYLSTAIVFHKCAVDSALPQAMRQVVCIEASLKLQPDSPDTVAARVWGRLENLLPGAPLRRYVEHCTTHSTNFEVEMLQDSEGLFRFKNLQDLRANSEVTIHPPMISLPEEMCCDVHVAPAGAQGVPIRPESRIFPAISPP